MRLRHGQTLRPQSNSAKRSGLHETWLLKQTKIKMMLPAAISDEKRVQLTGSTSTSVRERDGTRFQCALQKHPYDRLVGTGVRKIYENRLSPPRIDATISRRLATRNHHTSAEADELLTKLCCYEKRVSWTGKTRNVRDTKKGIRRARTDVRIANGTERDHENMFPAASNSDDTIMGMYPNFPTFMSCTFRTKYEKYSTLLYADSKILTYTEIGCRTVNHESIVYVGAVAP
ncbi:hypothetical protein BJ508DRAFT_311127 [Ascobolus immersus RN42]|uniref:Uncharacterized protein n=1 Tax=Ascobolus immersus RN42 TaxID=1160509 RepID=A0A3N4HRQ5_ASCIM|nr:hypothetical protein BJ508DRAFT_311127 [Ascobolus immersus RN42]